MAVERVMRDSPAGSDAGAGSVLVVAIIAAMVMLASLSIPLYKGIANKGVAAAAADASALAAADTAVGITRGAPCEQAASVAGANGASLAACEVDGAVATVVAIVGAGPLAASSAATAGPPGGARH